MTKTFAMLYYYLIILALFLIIILDLSNNILTKLIENINQKNLMKIIIML